MRSASPYQFNLQDAQEIWSRIECPTLLLRGSESWTIEWEKYNRTRAFRSAKLVTIQNAGHWVHHDRLDETLAVIRNFLGV